MQIWIFLFLIELFLFYEIEYKCVNTLLKSSVECNGISFNVGLLGTSQFLEN